MTRVLSISGIVVSLLLLGAESAWALQYFDGEVKDCPQTGHLLGYIVSCMRIAVEGATTFYMDAMYTGFLDSAIVAFITLAVVLFGVQTLMGVGELKQKAVALLIKIGIVLTFANSMDGFSTNLFGITDEAALVVTEAIDTGSVRMACDSSHFDVPDSELRWGVGGNVWGYLDCIVDKLFGTGNRVKLFNSLFGLLPSLIFGSAVGVASFGVGLIALLSVLLFVFRAAYIFIISYVYLGLLLMLCSVFVPFILLGVTSSYFYKWVNAGVAAMAMPAFVMAYLLVSLPILDSTIFNDGSNTVNNDINSADSLAQLEKKLHDDRLTPAQGEWSTLYRMPRQIWSQQIPSDREFYAGQGVPGAPVGVGALDTGFDNYFGETANRTVPILSGATDLGSAVQMSSIDMGEKTDYNIGEIFNASASLLFTVLVISMVMEAIPMLVSNIFGGGFALTASVQGSPISTPLLGSKSRAHVPGHAIGGGGGLGGLFSKGVPGAGKGGR